MRTFNEAERVFYETIHERAVTARSAGSRKSTVGASGCTLPSEYLSTKEKKALNGKVKTYNLNTMTEEEFNSAPEDIKQMYLKHKEESKK